MTPGGAHSSGVFIDTSAFYAAVDRDDRWHRAAVEGFLGLVRERRPVHTTNLIVAETYVLLLTRLNRSVATQWLHAVDMPIRFQLQEDHHRVKNLLSRQPGLALSYADALSFLTMDDLGIRQAFTFDRHFQAYGLEVFPQTLL